MRRNECFRFGGIWEVYGEITRRGGIAAERMSARRNGCLRFGEKHGQRGDDYPPERRTHQEGKDHTGWQCPLDTSGKDNADSQPGVLFYSTTGYGSENAGGRRRSFSPGGVSARKVDFWGDFSAEKGSAELRDFPTAGPAGCSVLFSGETGRKKAPVRRPYNLLSAGNLQNTKRRWLFWPLSRQPLRLPV